MTERRIGIAEQACPAAKIEDLFGASAGQIEVKIPIDRPPAVQIANFRQVRVFVNVNQALVLATFLCVTFECSYERSDSAFRPALWMALTKPDSSAGEVNRNTRPANPSVRAMVALSLLFLVIDHKSEEGSIKAFRTSRRELITAISPATGYRSPNDTPQA